MNIISNNLWQNKTARRRRKEKPDVSPPGYAPSRLRPATCMQYYNLRPAIHMHHSVRVLP